MPLALDPGTHACRSLRRAIDRLVARRCRSVVAWLADGELQRAWVERLAVPFFPCEGHLAIPGDAADELAQLFPVPFQDLLVDGRIPYGDPVSRQLLAAIVESLLPPATVSGDICCFAQPGDGQSPGDIDPSLERRREFVSRLIRLRGYEPIPLNPAVALALAEMEREQYTGLAVSLGASGCDLALVHRGNPAVALRIEKGGRWLDEMLAQETDRRSHDLAGQPVLDLEGARRRRESASPDSPADDDERIIARLYRQLAAELAAGIERLVAGNSLLVEFARPMTLVLGGGAARMTGFDEMLRAELAHRVPGETIGEIRPEPRGDYGVARGLLIRATLTTEGRRSQRLSA